MAKETNKNLSVIKESQDIFEKFEQLDDKIIIAELENQVVDDWVYHFVQDGKDIWGIGKAGIDGCTKEMGRKGIALREDSVIFTVDPTHPEYVLFTACVSKHYVDKSGEAKVESAIGTKRQWIMLRRKIEGEYKIVPNKFWFEQGSIKALRNAKSRLIPDDIKAKIITFAKTHKKVKKIEAPTVKKPEEAKPLTKNKPPLSEAPAFPDDREKSLGFPPEEEEKKQAEMPLQKDIMALTGLEATLVDKYGFTPDQIIEKLEEKYGEANLSKLTKEQTKEATEYFKETIEYLNKNK